MNCLVLCGLACFSLALVQGQKLSGHSSVTSALVRDLKHECDPHVRPNADNGGPQIWVNLHLFGLEKLKDRTNVLQAGFSVDLRWNDPRLSWDQAEFNNISNIFFPIKHMWIPDITIWQSADPNKEFFSKEQNIAQVFSSGDVLFAPKALMTVYSNMTDNKDTGDIEYRATFYLGSWMLNDGQIDIQASQPIIDLQMMHWSPIRLGNTSISRVVQVFNEIPGFDGYPLLEVNMMAVERGSTKKTMIQ